jgi:hypothetical protein
MNIIKKKGRPPKPISFYTNNPNCIIPIDDLNMPVGESFDESDGLLAKFIIEEPKIFASFLSILYCYEPVFTLCITDNGIIFQRKNPTGLSKVTSKLFGIKDYVYHSSAPFYFNINISELRKKIPTTSQGEFSIAIRTMDQPEPHVVLCVQCFDDKNNIMKNSVMNIESIDKPDSFNTTTLSYDVILNIASQWFKTEMKQLKTNGVTYVNIDYNGKETIILKDVKPNGDSLTINPSQKMKYIKQSNSLISCKLNLSSFFEFLKSEKISNTFKIYLSNQYPVVFEYNISTYGTVQFFINSIV